MKNYLLIFFSVVSFTLFSQESQTINFGSNLSNATAKQTLPNSELDTDMDPYNEIILPLGFDVQMGNIQNAYPFGENFPMRYQQILLGSEIKFQEITKLCLRANEFNLGNSLGGTNNVTIKLGRSRLSPSSITSTFDNNYDGPVTTVFDGIVTIPPYPAGGGNINSFDICIDFERHFRLYSGNLIIEIQSDGFIPVGSFNVHFIDACNDCYSQTNRVFNVGDKNAKTGSIDLQVTAGLIMKLGGNVLPIPTMSEWGLIILMLCLLIVCTLGLRQRIAKQLSQGIH